jgi:uncharacterized phage protein (TIGR01671 family)
MRVIKFRQWQPDVKRFLYIYPMQTNDTVKAEHILHAGELQQYTGLKDKNGKEIYEGDILTNVANQSFDYVTKPFVVEWGDEQNYCGFIARILDQKIGELFINKNFLNCEIIGNIYENPELLN